MFQEVEKLGGMAAALREGFPQEAVPPLPPKKFKPSRAVVIRSWA